MRTLVSVYIFVYVLVPTTTSNVTLEVMLIFFFFEMESLIGPQLSKQASIGNLPVSASSELGLQMWVTTLGTAGLGPHAFQTSTYWLGYVTSHKVSCYKIVI